VGGEGGYNYCSQIETAVREDLGPETGGQHCHIGLSKFPRLAAGVAIMALNGYGVRAVVTCNRRYNLGLGKYGKGPYTVKKLTENSVSLTGCNRLTCKGDRKLF
jgi:hypothetical protein